MAEIIKFKQHSELESQVKNLHKFSDDKKNPIGQNSKFCDMLSGKNKAKEKPQEKNFHTIKSENKTTNSVNNHKNQSKIQSDNSKSAQNVKFEESHASYEYEQLEQNTQTTNSLSKEKDANHENIIISYDDLKKQRINSEIIDIESDDILNELFTDNSNQVKEEDIFFNDISQNKNLAYTTLEEQRLKESVLEEDILSSKQETLTKLSPHNQFFDVSIDEFTDIMSHTDNISLEGESDFKTEILSNNEITKEIDGDLSKNSDIDQKIEVSLSAEDLLSNVKIPEKFEIIKEEIIDQEIKEDIDLIANIQNPQVIVNQVAVDNSESGENFLEQKIFNDGKSETGEQNHQSETGKNEGTNPIIAQKDASTKTESENFLKNFRAEKDKTLIETPISEEISLDELTQPSDLKFIERPIERSNLNRVEIKSDIQKPPHEQINFAIKKSMETGTHKISVKLYPEALGRVDIDIQITKNQIKDIKITVEKQMALQELIKEASQIEKMVTEIGKSSDINLSFNLRQQSEENPNSQKLNNFNNNSSDKEIVAVSDKKSSQQYIISDSKVDIKV